MCIIIDANTAPSMTAGAPQALPVLGWIKRGTSRIAIGGTKQAIEYAKLKEFIKLLAVLDRAGRLRRYDNKTVDDLQHGLEEDGNLQSDDPHIIALAVVSGCRLLFSHDQALHADFTNPHILQPKGSVYQNASHAHLLTSSPQCAQ